MENQDQHKIRPPGQRIRELLAERGWTQDDLAQVLNKPRPSVVNVINGKKAVTPELAVALGTVFRTGPEYWMQLESQYRLSLAPKTDEKAVAHRVRLYEIAPVKEMEKRGWIKSTGSAVELEAELCRFFGVPSLDQEPAISVATKRTSRDEPLSPSQRAWCFRARQLAQIVHAEKFKPELLPHCGKRLRELAAFPDEAKNVAKVLAGYGIRFVIVEPLAGSRMDGAAFWLAPDAPVIALSVRFDRIDAFWFALAHEFAHVENGDASVDAELVGESAMPTEAKPDIERRADEGAAKLLIPPEKLQSFITRVGPLYSKARINQFANVMKIHPGVIVGQLQHRGEVAWSAHREVLSKVRAIVTSTAMTDGWGRVYNPSAI